MVLILLLGISMASAATVSFSDISEKHWARESIQALINAKVIDGFPDGSYKPSQKVTREQFAKILVLALDISLDKNAKQTFTDIGPTHWAFYYVDAIKAYLPGYKDIDGTLSFKGKNPVLREEVAAALVKAKQLDIAQIANSKILSERFKDSNSVSASLLPYVRMAVEKKYISGYLDGTFKGKGALTRAEVAALFYQSKLLQNVTNQTTPAPTISNEDVARNITGIIATKGKLNNLDYIEILGNKYYLKSSSDINVAVVNAKVECLVNGLNTVLSLKVITPPPVVVTTVPRVYDILAPLTGGVAGQVEEVTKDDDKLISLSIGGRTFSFEDKIYDRENSIKKTIILVKFELNSDSQISTFDLATDVIPLLSAGRKLTVFTIMATPFEKGLSQSSKDTFAPAKTLRVLDEDGNFYEIYTADTILLKNGNLMKLTDFKVGNLIAVDKTNNPGYVVLKPIE